jgi:hypothetical protein
MNPEIRVAGRADLVMRTIAWLELGSWTPRAVATLRGQAADNPEQLALYVTLVRRLGRLSTCAACRCWGVERERCRWAITKHAPGQDEVTEWARLIHEAGLTMERERTAGRMPSWRRC